MRAQVALLVLCVVVGLVRSCPRRPPKLGPLGDHRASAKKSTRQGPSGGPVGVHWEPPWRRAREGLAGEREHAPPRITAPPREARRLLVPKDFTKSGIRNRPHGRPGPPEPHGPHGKSSTRVPHVKSSPCKKGKCSRPEFHPETQFFCTISRSRGVCSLVTEGSEPLISRSCLGDTPCDGSRGTVSLNGTDYTIKFCQQEEETFHPFARLINRGNKEREEATDKLKAICAHPDRPGKPERKRPQSPERPRHAPFWYFTACNVTTATGEALKMKQCPKDRACNLGPHDTRLNDTEVLVTFCEKPEEIEDERKGNQQPLWFKAACRVETKDGESLKEELCAAEVDCITRLTDIEYKGERVDAGYCGGLLHGPRRGRLPDDDDKDDDNDDDDDNGNDDDDVADKRRRSDDRRQPGFGHRG